MRVGATPAIALSGRFPHAENAERFQSWTKMQPETVAGVSAPETVSGCIFVHDWNRSAFSACGKRPERAIAGVAPTRILRRAGEYRAGAAALHREIGRLACQSNRKRHPRKIRFDLWL